MKLNSKEKNDRIETILDISYQIKKIYKNISLAELNNNKKEYKLNLNYLEIVSETENKLINELDITLDNVDLFINRINYININRDENEEDKTMTFNRINSYFKKKFYENPFLSISKNYNDQITDNYNCINNEIYNSIIRNLIIKLQQKINIEQNKKIKELLINTKLELLYTNVLFEKNLLYKYNLEVIGRNRCIIFNQNENLINKIFKDMSQENINNSITELLTINNVELNDNNSLIKAEAKTNQIFALALLESNLDEMTDEELSKFYLEFYKNFLNTEQSEMFKNVSSDSYDKLITLFNQKINNKKPKQKKV